MQKLLLIILCWVWSVQAIAQPNITKAEYYIDSDPGFGSGTDIPVAAGINVVDQSFAVALGAVPVGLHAVFIRSKNAVGSWSVTNPLFFYRQTATGSAPNITKAEYYFDNDPGFGLATNITLTAGTNIQDLNFNPAIVSLPVGLHVLSVRSRDANGSWSLTNQLLFFKKTSITSAPNITKAEYYLDNDPGFGFATAIPLTAGVDVQDLGFAPAIQNLAIGLHVLNLRSSNALVNWSVTNQLLFYKTPPAPGGITAIEYFYDSEPGFGQGIPVAINETTNLPDYLVPVNITGLTVGPHKMFLRSRSSNGWSITNIFPFDVNTAAATPFININSITNKENCTWSQFRISFHATGNYLPNNTFTVQLSDSSGDFISPINIGQVTAQQSSIVSCQLPAHLVSSRAYRLRVVSSNTAVIGVASLDSVNIHDRPELGNDTTVFIVCAGETLNLLPLYNTSGLFSNWSTATPTQAGAGSHTLIVTNIYGCRDTALATVKQDVAFWTGIMSSDWHLAANWSTLKIPTAKTHVIIPGNAINNCEIVNAEAFAASVQLRSAGNIALRNNHTLVIIANCNPLPTGL